MTGTMIRTEGSRRAYRPAAVIVAVCAVLISGCSSSSSDPVSTANASAAQSEAPDTATQDAADSNADGTRVEFVNASAATVQVSAENGPQFVNVAQGESTTSRAPNFRIYDGDGGYLMELFVGFEASDDAFSHGIQGVTDAGESCFTADLSYSLRDRSSNSTEVSCDGRQLELAWPEAPSGSVQVTFTGDQW